MADGYDGLPGAFPYAFRASGSWLFRSYAVVSALAVGVIGLLIVFGLVVLIAQTASVEGGALTLSRSFYAVVGLLLVVPILAPTLLVARRHRRGDDADRTANAATEADADATGDRYDAGLALAGYLFLVALYVGLVIAVPSELQTPARPFTLPVVGITVSALVPVVTFLYDLPAGYGVVPPVVAAAAVAVVHRALA